MAVPRAAVTAFWSLLLILATSTAHPQHALFYQQQQQPGLLYQQQQQQPGRLFYPAPPASNKLVASVVHSSAVPGSRDSSPYVIVYPGVAIGQPPVLRQQPILSGDVVYRAEGEEEAVGEAPEPPPSQPSGWWATIINIFAPTYNNESPTSTPAPVVAEVEEATTASSAVADNKPEKVVDEIMVAVETGDKSGNLETLDEAVPDAVEGGDKPTLVRVDGGGPQYLAVQQPQFYGNFANLQQLAGPGGPVAEFLRNRQPEAQVPLYPSPLYQYQPLPFPKHLPLAPAAPEALEAPGAAAIDFQRRLQAARLAAGPDSAGLSQRSAVIPGSKHVDVSQNLDKFLAQAHKLQETYTGAVKTEVERQSGEKHPGLINVGPGYQTVYYLVGKQASEDNQAVTVVSQGANKGKGEPDKIEAVGDQAGPSVAQAKPQAIALAGPGGTAAATPVATALVGPGGLAVSAPTATAVAGQTGGGTLTGPVAAAVNKYYTLAGGGKKATEDFSHVEYATAT